MPLIYDAIDSDSDGLITTKEFGIYFQSINVFDENAIKLAFMAMDLDGDNCLSRSEFAAFGKDFFLSVDEESPSKYFFGPLNE
jgi:Ca2+-binding EF-hand superfamily protein